MSFETELLEITSDNLSEAQFMSSNFINVSVQNRVFFNVIGSEAVISYLGKLGLDVEGISSIHSIKRIVEKVDIADIILDNIHIDVRVVFNENEIFVPKSHYAMGIVPDIYAVLKFDKSFQRIIFIGYFEPSELDLNSSNSEYYFMDPEKLHSPFDMFDFICNFKGKTDGNLSDAQILKGRELSVSVADHDVTDEEFNEFVNLLSKSSALRNSVLEYDNFETLASKVAMALKVSKSKNQSENEVVDFDDFINMSDSAEQTAEDSEAELESSDITQNEVQDLNGDDLLDDMVDGVQNIAPGVAGAAAGVAGAIGAANIAGAQAVSQEAMDLAAVAGEIVSDETEELFENGIENITDSSAQKVSTSESDLADSEKEDLSSGTEEYFNDTTDSIESEISEDNTEDEASEIVDVNNSDKNNDENEIEAEIKIDTDDSSDEILQDEEIENEENVADEIISDDNEPDVFDEDLQDFPQIDLSEGSLAVEEEFENIDIPETQDGNETEIFAEDNEDVVEESSEDEIKEQETETETCSDPEPADEESQNEENAQDETAETVDSIDEETNFELKEEELDFGDFENEINIDDFDNLLTEESTETEEAKDTDNYTGGDSELNETQGIAEESVNEDTLSVNDENLSIDLSHEDDLNLEDLEDISLTEADNDEPKDLQPEQDDANFDIAQEETEEFNFEESDSPSEQVSNDEESSNAEFSDSLDIGESFDATNEELSDIFDDNSAGDFDFGDSDDLSSSEDTEDFVITEEPVENEQEQEIKIESENTLVSDDLSIENDAVNEGNDSDNEDVLPDADLEDLSVINDEQSDSGLSSNSEALEDFSETNNSNTFDLDNNSWDGEFSVPSESDIDGGDDDLIFAKDKTDSSELINAESESVLDDIAVADTGMELPVFVPPENDSQDINSENTHDFEELPTEHVEQQPDAGDYELVNFSDLTDSPTAAPYNAEVSFADIEDFANFETIAPVDDNSEIDYFSDSYEMDDLLNANAVKENSFVISDKNHTPGEIFIDINKDPSRVDISDTNEHLEELYSNNNNIISEESVLNSSAGTSNEKGKLIPVVLGIGGVAFVLIIAGIIMLSVSKFMNPSNNEAEPLVADNTLQNNNNLGDDVPNMNPDNNSGVVMNNNQTQGSVPQQSAQNNNLQGVNSGQVNPVPSQGSVTPASKPIPATSFLSVRKLSWEVPDYISTDISFKQYFQSAGKSLKAALSSDLLLATDYTYSDQIRVSILYGNDGSFQRAKILLSSGSAQVDNIVLQSVNQTLKVLKAPNSLGNDQSTTVILKIYL